MKVPKQTFTLEFKQLAIKRLKTEQSVAGVARELGPIKQTLQNWVKVASKGALKDAKNGGVIGSDIPLSASVPTVSVWT